MGGINVIIPTRRRHHVIEAIESLKNLPFPIHLDVVSEGDNWPVAVNIGLRRIKPGDVILMDDDVRILPETFKEFEQFYHMADIFGFKLLFPDMKTIQHGGGLIRRDAMTHLHYKEPREKSVNMLYVAHVTASLMYIKRHVLDDIGLMEEMPGHQFEDVDFNLRALQKGYKILYLPSIAIHGETITKSHDKKHKEKMEQNRRIIIEKYLTDDKLAAILESYPRLAWED